MDMLTAKAHLKRGECRECARKGLAYVEKSAGSGYAQLKGECRVCKQQLSPGLGLEAACTQSCPHVLSYHDHTPLLSSERYHLRFF